VLVAVLWLTGSEAKAAVAGLAALPPYYALLYLFRKRISKGVAFHIETTDL
jgi:sigma-E factor negative regulatory protein RseC